MPANRTSLLLTERYRDQLQALRARVDAGVDSTWRGLDEAELDRSFDEWLARASGLTAAGQAAAVGLTEAYLSAFLTSELDRPLGAAIDGDHLVAVDAFERPIERALAPALITVKATIGDGEPVATALERGRARALRIAGEAVVESARLALATGMAEDPNVVGWRRVPRGTCGACMADTRSFIREPGEAMLRHPNCLCVAEPAVRGVRDRIPRPSGEQLLERMGASERVAQFGAEKAELLRAGEITLDDLSHREELVLGGAILSEASLAEITT